ncbi:MAG TPA: 5'-3' exonuclease H3TH domain-containing protein, partial [Terriglobales bacterium]|nr:5'-3' exonuclease H3TH domain-containing protein [Terriglobales bacterium]
MPPKRSKSNAAPAAVAENPVAPLKAVQPAGSKAPVFLMDAMSFIFRAYHAMARQRPMSTRTGIPTAGTYVFVNMLRKLVADFHPEYLAAIFDVAAPTFRDQQAAAITSVRKFDIKTQTFKQVEYGGYKAQRGEMPPDLAQQIPYIRRALEAYRIPILEYPGFEADDVIATLAHQAAAQSYPVYVVSSDKDMLQLVNDKICVLNPPKDNLICDRAKVEEILGVPPERVVDVMALRGDSIDNIPGAPGIGDKGSVELIRRFGSLEAALDRAAEVEKKTYRESLLNNRETILFSKEMVTLDRNAPVELHLEAMRAGEPDAEAARQLFTELEFSTLLKDFLPGLEVGETEYLEAKSASDVERVLQSLAHGSALAVAVDVATPAAATELEEAIEEEDDTRLPLAEAQPAMVPPACNIAISAAPGKALTVPLEDGAIADGVKTVLADPSLPKAVHDAKSAMHALEPRGATLAGVRDEPMLNSYLLDPTYATHSLADIALRRFNLKLSGSLAEAADVTGRMAAALRREVEQAGLMRVYEDIDLPLVPVLLRMERAGVKIDTRVLAAMSKRLERECDA